MPYGRRAHVAAATHQAAATATTTEATITRDGSDTPRASKASHQTAFAMRRTAAAPNAICAALDRGGWRLIKPAPVMTSANTAAPTTGQLETAAQLKGETRKGVRF